MRTYNHQHVPSIVACFPRLQAKPRAIQASISRNVRCNAFADGQGSECLKWETSDDTVGRNNVVNHSDMQAGFSGRIDELHDLHVDVVDNRYLVDGEFTTASITDTIPHGIECQNVTPWRHMHRSVNLLKAKSIWGEINEVYVFLFGGETPGCTGIYSLRTFTLENVPRETVIAFECLDDAVRYAGLLSSTMNHDPTVHGITPEQLAEFCMDSGYNCQLEAAGSSLAPPGFNVRITDWERASRLRLGDFSVLSDEPYGDSAYDSEAAYDMELSGSSQAVTLEIVPPVLESITPTLEEQVALYYNHPELLRMSSFDRAFDSPFDSSFKSYGDSMVEGLQDDWDVETDPQSLEAARQQLERNHPELLRMSSFDGAFKRPFDSSSNISADSVEEDSQDVWDVETNPQSLETARQQLERLL